MYKRRLVTAFTSLAFLLGCVVLPASAYTVQYSDPSGSVVMRWPSKTIEIALSSSLDSPPSNIKTGSDVRGAVKRALARWAEAAGVTFKEISADALSVSPAGEGDGLSVITVADTSENRAVFDNEDRTGRTRVFYDAATGVISEADLAINPSALFSTDGSEGTYDLEATFTHEIGHVLGLEHSLEAGSAMQPRQGVNGLYQQTAHGSRSLSDDDVAGARALYDTPQTFGAMTGTISDSVGSPVESVHVWVEDVVTGKVVAGNMTAADGTYRIEGLGPGEYYIVADDAVDEHMKVKVGVGREVQHDIALVSYEHKVTPQVFGSNGHLSTIAVPLPQGRRVRIFVGGPGIDLIAGNGVSVTSPFIQVNQGSLTLLSGISYEHPIISFDVEVSSAAPPGNYSIRLQSKTGEIAYVPGGLRVDIPTESATPRGTVPEQIAMVGTMRVLEALLDSLLAR